MHPLELWQLGLECPFCAIVWVDLNIMDGECRERSTLPFQPSIISDRYSGGDTLLVNGQSHAAYWMLTVP